MKKKKKLYMVTGGCLLALFVAAMAAGYYFHARHEKESPLYSLLNSCSEEQWGRMSLRNSAFSENSGEGIFLRGLDAFAQQDPAAAKALFEQALAAPGRDPALPTFLYYYINLCHWKMNGAGDPETVSLALSAASKYAPLANDTVILGDLINSLMPSGGTNEQAIALMREYLEQAKHLELATWAWIKNFIAMLEYNNRAYASSIRGFYDVEQALETVEMTEELELIRRFSKEYIANIYFTFEDYEKAAAMYRELIEISSKDDVFHSYGCCLNMAGACLEIPDFESAREAMRILEERLPRVEADIAAEVEASMNEMLASICIEEENYAAADAYLDKAEAYYQKGDDSIFLGGEYFILLTRCNYLFHLGELEEAQRILEEIVAEGAAADYGLEKSTYELLKEIYQATEQQDKLVQAYQNLLEMDKDFTLTTQREYLEFSEYYRENSQLIKRNTTLSRTNAISLFGIIAVSGVLVLALVMLRLLSTKNITDQLTGVYNRKKLNQLLRSYRRSGTPANLGVAMMDIDDFKKYNDTCGHAAGDEVLKEVAAVLMGCVRSGDLVIRYGGEEFLVLLREVPAQTAEAVCQRIREQLRAKAIPSAASAAAAYVTLSIGLCHQASAKSASLEKLIECADECLYQSKEAGKNCVTAELI